jgi:hypothetical protein
MPVTFTIEYAEKLNRESESRRYTKVLGKERPQEDILPTGRSMSFPIPEKKEEKEPEIQYEEGWLLKQAPQEVENKEPLPENPTEPAKEGLTIEKPKRKYTKRAVNG